MYVCGGGGGGGGGGAGSDIHSTSSVDAIVARLIGVVFKLRLSGVIR